MLAAGRRAEGLAGTVEAVAKAGGTATAVAADLRDLGAVDGLVDRAMNDTGRLDVMVDNAGVSFRGGLADGDSEAWREMLEVNVLALAVGSRAAVRAMRACGAEGHIVNVSSSASRLEAPGFYGATKTAVNAITASLRQELEHDTIRVTTVIPGPTATNLARHHPDVLRGVRAAIGAATLDDGSMLSAATARRVACDAGIVPAVLGGKGQVLDVGRERRLFTGPLRRALVLRDRGCAFPGCDRPPRWTDGHHIVHWIDGGPTSLSNAVLLCGYHHRVIHQGHWRVRINPTDGLPDFIPPRYVDPGHRPRRNIYHRD